MEVTANKVAGWDDLKQPGDWYFMPDSQGNEFAYLVYVCPCGNCGRQYLSQIPISEADHSGRPRWQWNGDQENPSLTPSIQRRVEIHAHGDEPAYKCDWHGYLTDGVFRSC